MKKFITKFLGLAFWIAIWQIVYIYCKDNFLIVSPIDCIKYIYKLLLNEETYIIIGYSMLRILIGLIIAIFIGSILGYLSFKNNILKAINEALINIMKAVPVVAFIILALVTFPHKIIVSLIVFLMICPTFYYMAIALLENTDKKLIEMAKIYAVKPIDKIKNIYMNCNKKNVKSSFLSAIGFAFKSGVTAEVLVLPKNSIGMMLYNSKIYLDIMPLVSYTLLLVLVCIIFQYIVTLLIEKIFSE